MGISSSKVLFSCDPVCVADGCFFSPHFDAYKLSGLPRALPRHDTLQVVHRLLSPAPLGSCLGACLHYYYYYTCTYIVRNYIVVCSLFLQPTPGCPRDRGLASREERDMMSNLPQEKGRPAEVYVGLGLAAGFMDVFANDIP